MDLRCSIDSFIYVFDLSQCTISNPDDKSSEIAVIEGGIVKLGDNPVWSNATLRLNGATSEITMVVMFSRLAATELYV